MELVKLDGDLGFGIFAKADISMSRKEPLPFLIANETLRGGIYIVITFIESQKVSKILSTSRKFRNEDKLVTFDGPGYFLNNRCKKFNIKLEPDSPGSDTWRAFVTRKIKKGDELTISYGADYGFGREGCRCEDCVKT